MTTISTPATQPTAPAPSGPPAVPSFAVIGGAQVRKVLHGQETQIVQLVETAYRLHAFGESVNPPSYFLHFPDRPSARIIALPASLGGQLRVDGLKWISSRSEEHTSELQSLRHLVCR